MKKLLGILVVACFLCLTSVCLAEEVKEGEGVAIQETDIDASGVVAVVNKQPKANGIIQRVKIRRCGLIFVINVNGKVQVTGDTEE